MATLSTTTRAAPDRIDLENAIAAMDINREILTALHEYSIHRSLPPWVRKQLKLALLAGMRAGQYLGIEHGRIEEALLREGDQP